MIKTKKINTIDPLQQSVSRLETKNISEYNKNTDQQENQKIKKYGLLKYILLKAKVSKINNAFTEKIMRTLDTDDDVMQKLWKEKQLQMMQNPWKGLEYPQWLQHILQIMNLIIFPLLIIESSFEAFLDEFSDKYSNNSITICFKTACFTVTLLRFIMKCTTVTFSQGQFRKQIKQIIKAYLKQMRLFFDLTLLILQFLTIVLPFNMIISAILFFCLNLLNVYPGHQTVRIEAAYIQNKKTSLLWSLLKIMFFNVFFAHFMAAIILAMARIQPEKSWMVNAQISEAQWYTKYVYAYYWATTMMMTVGFGDILPGNNNQEIILTSFLEMFSCIVLGYNISSIGNIVSAIRCADQKINKKIVVFERMIKKDRKNNIQIDKFLEKQISNYLRQLRLDKDNLEYVERDQFLSELPQDLRRSYYKDVNKRIFRTVMFFNLLRPSTLEHLAQIFRSTLFSNGQYIKSQYGRMLILQKGKIGLGYKRKGSKLNGYIMQTVSSETQKENIFLNPSCFLVFKYEKNYSLISKSSSVIWSIQFQQFLQILSQSKIDYQYYYTLLHKHYVDENQWEYILCKRCSNKSCSRYHSVFRCAKITYLPIRNKIARSYYSNKNSKQQKRVKNYIRNRSFFAKKNALLQRKQSVVNYQRSLCGNKQPKFLNQISCLNKEKVTQKTKEQNQYFHGLSESGLKKIIREVLFEYETGYQDFYWHLQCDQIHDYKYYFPQDNANRLFLTPTYANPRNFNSKNEETLEFSHRLRKICHSF